MPDNRNYIKYKKHLINLYNKYNKREFVHPDPLEFLYLYEKALDREIVGLIASSLAYGKVAQILKSVWSVLEPMGKSPHDFLLCQNRGTLIEFFGNFKHRFTTSPELVDFLLKIRESINEFGSLNKLFLTGYDGNIQSGLCFFTKRLTNNQKNSLLPEPSKASACKRLYLYLRWMVRADEVDPGGWEGIKPSQLIIPLDTHMYNICKTLGLTNRNQANIKTSIEITRAFIDICPEDPVKFDFALTRLGIRTDTDMNGFFRTCEIKGFC